MVSLLTFGFYIGVFLIALSYVFYPILVVYLPAKKPAPRTFSPSDLLPEVTVIFAAYNEADVIEKKLRSVFNSNYPPEKLHVLVGSDNSTDQTDNIILELTREYRNLQLVKFQYRTGKSGIINKLVELSKTPFLVATDANIIFQPDTIFNLIKPFKEPNIKLVGGNIIYQTHKQDGIALQEEVYLNWENKIKQAESKHWWIALGVEGGCYAIRKSAFSEIPPLTFMEDFYVTMSVLQQGGNVWFEPEAVCYEDVSTEIAEEFKRKVRISIGNWQNLNRFSRMLFAPLWPTGFAFLAHKVLRWFTPFLSVFVLGIAFLLSGQGNIYSTFTMLAAVVFVLLPLDFVLLKRNMHTGILRFLNHFIMMNFALIIGFIKYAKGIKSNVWQPTKRNQ